MKAAYYFVFDMVVFDMIRLSLCKIDRMHAGQRKSPEIHSDFKAFFLVRSTGLEPVLG